MSNPGVVTLDSMGTKDGKFKRFVVEDNIGEAIHVHIDDMRIDFTVKEFIEFSAMIRESLRKIDFLCGHTIDKFDECFLRSCAHYLTELVKVKIEEVRLSDLKCIIPWRVKKNLTLNKVASVYELPTYKYLGGDKSEYLDLDPYEYSAVNKEANLLRTLALFKKDKYPVNERYIILFDGQQYIRYGEEYAAILGHLHGRDAAIKVMRFYFKDKKHLLHPLKDNMNIISKYIFRRKRKQIKEYLKGFFIKN